MTELYDAVLALAHASPYAVDHTPSTTRTTCAASTARPACPGTTRAELVGSRPYRRSAKALGYRERMPPVVTFALATAVVGGAGAVVTLGVLAVAAPAGEPS